LAYSSLRVGSIVSHPFGGVLVRIVLILGI
jgi:hypothetical protein